MKKLFAIIIISIFASACFVPKISKTQLPDDVIRAFRMKFPDAKKVKWEKEDSVYSAEFSMDKTMTEVEFDTNGIWLRTEWEVPIKFTPCAIKNYIDSAFAGCKFKKLNIVEFATEGQVYEAELKFGNENRDVYFTLNGVFKRTVKERVIK